MRKIIIANWKCNPKTRTEAEKLFVSVLKGIKNIKNTEIVFCPPFVYLSKLSSDKSRSLASIKLGGQDCHWEQSGSYTGEVSPKMLKDLGCKYVIIGHSERRAMGETEEIIEKKLRAALKAGLIPILCIGEKKGEDARKIISKQLKKNLKGAIIAYEPVWAIGTGDFCKPQKAKQALDFIRGKLNNKVLYGGSVNSKIASDYIKVGFDGLLVGGASLDAKEFIKIVKNAQV